jgi:peptidoglycan/LPS O-acetylase OafA/YrhL
MNETTKMKSQSYIQTIDGLRTLAVMLVVIFHAGYSWLGGGFIGVDVFFVISGFLITRNITKELGQGN